MLLRVALLALITYKNKAFPFPIPHAVIEIFFFIENSRIFSRTKKSDLNGVIFFYGFVSFV